MASALSGASLALSLILLGTVRPRAIAFVLALQGWAVALAVFLRGLAEHAPQSWALAAAVLAASGVLAPLAMVRLEAEAEAEVETDPQAAGWMRQAGGLGLVALAVLLTASSPAPRDLALAVSVVLVGLLRIVAPARLIARIAGALAFWNGTILLAAGLAVTPLLGVMLLAWLAVPLAGLCVLRSGPRADAAG